MEFKVGKKVTMETTKKNTKKKEKHENLKKKRSDELKKKKLSKKLQKKPKEKKVRSSLQKIKLIDDDEEAEKLSQNSDYYSEEEETSGDELHVKGDGVSPSSTVVARKRGDANTSGGDNDDNDSFHSAEESDSSEDEVAPRNTIGEVPLEFYKDEEHIGYDVIGRKIKKKDRKDKLDAFLANVDDKKSWRRFIDEYNDEEVELTKKETKMINRILKGKTPHADVNPYEPYVDWFVWEGKGHPLSNAPEPKRRFIPSKSEAKKVKKYVRAFREGRITFDKPKEKEKVYLLWGDDSSSSGKTRGLSYIPPPKAKLPGHEEAYNPSLEYIPTQEEINSYQLMYEEDRPTFIPTRYTSLRSVPAYANFLKELFARCLDLYLCPRVIKKRVNIDPESLKKKLPDPKDLRPYPTTCYIEYKGHSGAVVTISTDSSGQWIASGSTDGTVRVWEVATGRCVRVWEIGSSIRQVAWNPSPDLPILALSVDQDVLILDTGLGSEEEQGKIKDLLHMQKSTISDESSDAAIVSWLSDDKLGGLRLKHSKTVTSIEWHRKGDYLSTVIPAGESRAIMIHQLSRKGSQSASVRTQAVITILSWLAWNGFAPRDDLISSLAKHIMEPPVTEEDDIVGCSILLNLIDAFHGVEVIEQQLKTREDYQEICSIMNVGMIYSLLHNSGDACKDPLQRRELLRRKFQEKISSDKLEKVEKAQATFWRGWKLKLEEQKRLADRVKVLEELIPGVETARFLSGDLQYMNSVVMSFIDSVRLQKKPILRDMLKLADTYGLNRTEVLLKFLACVLVSEVWSNEEIDAEISDFEGEILESATKTIDVITSVVYPVIDGCNKARLAYIFAQLSDCYLHLVETKGVHPSEIQGLGDSSVTLGHFYRVLEQECCRVSFITDLNFKNIVDINLGCLNSVHFNNEVCRHVSEFTVEALSKMVQALHSTITSTTSKDIISWQDVYKHHVVNLLENLEYRAKKIHLENPESLQSLLSEVEQTYDACSKHIRILECQSALVIMKRYFCNVIPLHFARESAFSDLYLNDCLIVLLNFWMKLNANMVEMAESSDEKFAAVSLMICLKVFLRLVVEGKITPSQGWGTVYFFANCSLLTSPMVYCSFCRAMILSGCEFGSVEAVFSEALSECSIDHGMRSDTMSGVTCYIDVCNLYVDILESILSNLVHDDSERHNLRNLLSSISRFEGDLEALKGVRTAVWERLAKFSDNLQLPSHVRVYVLEVLQFILGRKGKLSTDQGNSILPWEEWDEWNSSSKNTEFTAEQPLANQSEGSNRFDNALVALRTTQLAGSISSHLDISANDLLTVDSAVSCFAKVCEAADTHAHIGTLVAILDKWETLFLVEKKETSVEVSGASDAGNNWSDWDDEGWERESIHDEEPVQEEKIESLVSIHPLHTCWMEILRKLVMLSQFNEVVKLIDRSLKRSDLVLIDEDDASNLSNMLIGSDSFMALKVVLLLPYGTLHIRCLDAIENKLKLEGIPENTDKNLLILALSSGIISTIVSEPALGATFSYICYLVGNLSRQSQNFLLSRTNQNLIDDEIEGFCLTFVQILFPCFVSELVKANQQILAGFLVTKFMHTNPSLCLINVAEAGLSRYLRSHLQQLECRDSAPEARKPVILGQTLSNLELKLKNLIRSALILLPNSSS